MGYPKEINLNGKIYKHTENGIYESDLMSGTHTISYELLMGRGGFAILDACPQIGDEVIATHPKNVLEGKLLALTNQYAIISQGDEEQHLHLFNWKITKAKTADEKLRDELMEMATTAMSDENFDLDHNCYYLISGLMHKYKIEPRK